MKEELKKQLHALVDSIDDEAKLHLLMEDAAAYLADTEEEEDDMTEQEEAELDEAIAEAERGDVIPWEEMKNKMEEWRRR